MPKNRRLFCALLISTVVLSACGFKLRGSVLGQNLPFKSIYIDVPATSSLGSELRRNVRGSGELTVTETPKDAEAILKVLSETRAKTILSLNSQGRVREYGLNYTVVISVQDNKKADLLAPTTISLKRDISYNENQVLAKESEEAMLYQDMQSDAVQQILRRVAAIKPRQNADATAPASAPAAEPAAGTPAMSVPTPTPAGDVPPAPTR
ncbi:MAG TPA: LPS assembly lipoprotein LptE [Oxalicibacterium sp.]|jgi:LPS-assembly lipoprotein|nr:LPS assembly lipoprotein LptE [Oxalicibacterium sp.]